MLSAASARWAARAPCEPAGRDEPAEPAEAEPPSELGSYRLDLVESEDQLLAISDNPVFSSPDQQAAVAIDIEGGPERIYLIQVATAEGVV